ncbi:hypothetical protein RB11450 [Rhodopirellula baltica SH 1]|uniref:Uncharacterized protein n=1 Tax=Rhodopirellula baltica (strain DSM 10527 / NCIMB 13988 / SH1) TaxID=243090 RepID=Q7UEB4_RHOBA|nr:hypothetical protein RB11450 [Rhodopirellula baltica SH 1]
MGTQGIAPLADYHTIKGRRVTTSRVETLPILHRTSGSRGTRTHNGDLPQLFSRQCPHPAG